METDCFQLIFIFLFFWCLSVSHAALTVILLHAISVQADRFSTNALYYQSRTGTCCSYLPGVNFPPLIMPQGITSCQPNKAMAVPSSLMLLVRFSAGKMYVFPPSCILEGWPLAEAVCSALLYMYVLPKGNICSKSSYHLPNYFFILLLCLCSVW